MASPLSSVVVDFRAGFANLEKDLANINRQISGSASKMQSALSTIGKGMALAGVAVSINAVTNAITDQIDKLDALSEQAVRTGISVNELSKINFAGQMAGIDDMDTQINRLSKSINEAMTDTTSNQAAMFEALGISLTKTNGEVKNTTDILFEMADVFDEIPDGAQKAGLAMEIFGKSGAKMLNLFEGGSAQLQANMDSIKGSTQEAADMANEFNDNMDKLGAQAGELTKEITTAMLPTLIELQRAFMDSSEASAAWNAIIDVLVGAVKVLASAVIYLTYAVGEFLRTANLVANTLKNVATGNISGIVKDWGDRFNDMGAKSKEAANNISAVWSPTIKKAEEVTKKGSKALDDYNKKMAAIKERNKKGGADKLTDFEKALASLEEKIYSAKQGSTSNTAIGQLVRDLETGKIAVSEYEAELLAMKALEADAAIETQKHNDELAKGVERWQNLIEPTRAYRLELELMAEAYVQGSISADEMAIATSELAKQQKKANDESQDLINAIEGFGQDSAQAFADWCMGNEVSFSKMINSMIAELIKMVAYKNIFKPMFSYMGGMFGLVMSAPVDPNVDSRAASGSTAYSTPTLTGSSSAMPPPSSRSDEQAINITTVVNVEKGTSETKGDTSNQDAVALSKKLEAAVKDVIIKEKRAGGLLSNA
jgi:hypothetical protein